MSYLDETGLAYFWDKIKQTFWSLLSRSSDVSIYISKTGSDSNSGLSSSAPVATFARAVGIAQNYSTSGTIAFYVGAGEWGDVDIDGSMFRCRALKIANFTDSAPLTVSAFNSLSGASAPPHFSTLILRECTVSIGAIYASNIEFFQTYNLDSNIFFSFGRIVLHESYLALTNAIVNSSTSATNNIILTITSRLNIFGGTIHFDNITRDYFVSNDSASTIRIASDVTFSGTFTGAKYQFTSFTAIQNNGISPDDFPGTEAGYGGYYYHGTHRTRWNTAGTFNWIDANTFSVADASRPENGVFRPIAVVDSSGINAGGVEVGFQTNGGRYVCFQGRNRTNTGWLDGYRVTESVDGTITHTVGSSPAANADNKEIATTEWVIDKIASDSGVVHTTGAESISGTKTFSNASIYATNAPGMTFKHLQLDGIVNAPSDTKSWQLQFAAVNDTIFSRLRYEFTAAGTRNAMIGASNASGTFSQLIVGYDSNGVAYATAPATSSSRTGTTDIVTRGYLDGSSSGVVHTSGNETVGGTKTFSAPIVSSYASPAFSFANNTSTVNFCGGSSTSYTAGAKLILYGGSASSSAGCFDCSTGGSSRRSLIGNPNGTLTWNGQTVQTSSDERVKDFISSVPDGDLDSWGAVEWVRFKYRADVEAKGADACRWHTGLVSQHVERACASGPMDVLSYGMLCLDSVENEDTGKRDELWMVRYAEALCMEAAYMRRENSRLKKRVADLEERLAALELKIA